MGIDMTGGWGGGTKTALEQAEVDVVGLNYSAPSGANDPDSRIPYYNLRAEMYWNMRRALDPKNSEAVALPPDPKLLAEATSSRWELRQGKIKVEDKAEVKKRLGASPDLWDSYVTAWHIRGRGIVKQQTKRGGPRWQQPSAEPDPFAIDGYG